jgi:hypothetical protein
MNALISTQSAKTTIFTPILADWVSKTTFPYLSSASPVAPQNSINRLWLPQKFGFSQHSSSTTCPPKRY